MHVLGLTPGPELSVLNNLAIHTSSAPSPLWVLGLALHPVPRIVASFLKTELPLVVSAEDRKDS